VMESSTWQHNCQDIAFLVHLQALDRWTDAGLAWRSAFFIQGELYRRKGETQVFRALGSSTTCRAFWPCRQLSAHVWVEDEKARPEWLALLAWEDWEAFPSETLSPLGAFARGFSYDFSISHLIIRDARPPLKHAALLGFRGCSAANIRILGKELGLCQKGFGPLFPKLKMTFETFV
jgi:hypothetical protein